MPMINTGSAAIRQSRWMMALVFAVVILSSGLNELPAAEKAAAGTGIAAPLPFHQQDSAKPLTPPIDTDAYIATQPKVVPRQVNFQLPPPAAPQPIKPLVIESPETLPVPATQADPCGLVVEKPLGELGINIAIPAGELPADHGTVCLASLNTPVVRSFPTYYYQWDATCLCHRPLYFEEINLERYGYGCGCCLQPLASAAHFFGTVPALPYCMAAECPHECVYTLGHYRPGSCPPWRRHWPPADPLAAAAEGGVWTGMIFLIP